jgi:uncharacterized oligopeptide transporter (OPT) family protein
VLGGQLNLRMLGFGAVLGAIAIATDVALGRARLMRVPPLAIGLGIYLPMGVSLALSIGALIGHCYDRWSRHTTDADFAKRMGVLMATGLIVGESLFGVLYAGIVAGSGENEPFALVGASFASRALPAGAVIFFVLIGVLYRHTMSAVASRSRDA